MRYFPRRFQRYFQPYFQRCLQHWLRVRDARASIWRATEPVLRERHEAVSIANDALLGTWFLFGSAMLFVSRAVAACFFLLVGVHLLLRPAIRLSLWTRTRRLDGQASQVAGAEDRAS